MPVPVKIVSAGGLPVVSVADGGLFVTDADGFPVTISANGFGLPVVFENVGPGLSLSATTIEEGGTQGDDVLTFTPTNASNPGAVSLSSISPANTVQMNADGVTLEVGSTPPSVGFLTFTASYTDDAGVHSFPITLTVTALSALVTFDSTAVTFDSTTHTMDEAA